jgi:hypothetical protein
MKIIKKNKLKNALILSTICFGSNSNTIDPSNFDVLQGSRQSFFFLRSPSLLNQSLKTSFLLLKAFLNCNFQIIFIGNIDNLVLLNRFQKICTLKKHIFLQDININTGFLTNSKEFKTAIVTLFLDHEKAELIRNETTKLKIPVLSFSNFNFNKKASLISVAGNYTSFASQNFILSFISLFLCKKC